MYIYSFCSFIRNNWILHPSFCGQHSVILLNVALLRFPNPNYFKLKIIWFRWGSKQDTECGTKQNVTTKQDTQCNIRTTKLITEPKCGKGHYCSMANSSRLSILYPADERFVKRRLCTILNTRVFANPGIYSDVLPTRP